MKDKNGITFTANKAQKIEFLQKLFTIFMLSVSACLLVSLFLPFYKTIYSSTSSSSDRTYYLNNASNLTLILPICIVLSFVFAISRFKNKQILFLSFNFLSSFLYLLLVVSIKLSMKETDSYYSYSLLYGWYVALVFIILDFLLLSVHTILDLVAHYKIPQETFLPEPKKQSNIDILKDKLSLLENLKQQGILTDSEFEEKRSELVKSIKI